MPGIRCVLLVLATTIVCVAPESAVAQTRPQIADVMKAYCSAEDAQEWFCRTTAAPLPPSHMYDVLQAFCTTEDGRKHPDAWPGGDGVPAGPRAEVCTSFEKLLPPLLVEFDARQRGWSHSTRLFKVHKRTYETDPLSREPILHLKNGDVLHIQVVANPLLFSAARGEVKEESVPELAAAADLASGFGRVFGLTFPPPAAAPPPAEMRATDTELAAAAGVPERKPDEQAFDHDQKRLDALASATDAAGGGLRAQLDGLESAERALVTLAQQLELGPVKFDMSPLREDLEDLETWSDAFGAARTSLTHTPKLQAFRALFEAAASLMVADATKPVDVHAGALRYEQLAANMCADGEPCLALEYPKWVTASLQMVGKAAATAARDPKNATHEKTLRDALAAAREAHMGRVLTLSGRLGELHGLQAKLAEGVSEEKEVLKRALSLRRMASRARDAATRSLGDQMVIVSNKLFLPGVLYDGSWTKIRIHTLRVTADSPYTELVAAAPAKEVTTTYRIVSAGFDKVTFGVGMVFTDATSTTYAALDPDPSVNTTVTTSSSDGTAPNPVTTTSVARPEAKQIVEKERLSRKGSYGAFVNYRLTGSKEWGVGVQAGVATSVDYPALMLGPVLNLSPYVTVGGGIATFRVKSLGQGPDGQAQRVGDLVYSADQISSRETWTRSYYVSLSVNISGLPLFK